LLKRWIAAEGGWTYGDAVGVLLANALGFCLALLEGVLVLELGMHGWEQERVWGWRKLWSEQRSGGGRQ
jgi:hypothetical protein